jgi:RimJ/RimL family protein N-acetyltransferase
MRLRPYIACKDYEEIKNWISDERTHAMWCANLIQFPMEKDNFEKVMREAAERFGDSPYVATSEEGQLIGFFCYSVDLATNEGMLKFVMTNPDYRGKGYGKEMLQLAVKYAFEITNVDAVQLNVFPENIRAKKCYETIGFVERKTDKDAFAYKDESWGRCNMIIRK